MSLVRKTNAGLVIHCLSFLSQMRINLTDVIVVGKLVSFGRIERNLLNVIFMRFAREISICETAGKNLTNDRGNSPYLDNVRATRSRDWAIERRVTILDRKTIFIRRYKRFFTAPCVCARARASIPTRNRGQSVVYGRIPDTAYLGDSVSRVRTSHARRRRCAGHGRD